MAYDAKQFGEAVKTLRVGAGLTQAELAQKMGLTQAAVVMIEQGKRSASVETLDKLGAALNVPPECLSILAFRPMSNAKAIQDLTQSLQRLIVALVDARQSTTPVRSRTSPASGEVQRPRASKTSKTRKRLVAARTA